MASALPDPAEDDVKGIRRARFGGLIREYAQVAQGGQVSDTHRELEDAYRASDRCIDHNETWMAVCEYPRRHT
ncbi:hypothetical protein GCM10022224_102670 [Nonomuraea antimicrobica]|uniref:Uncharacterized protein n=1 Tax=Nonomuraea antimicrobica TaxID=561173 RepID=A0ABP7EL80_9ACTN